MRFYTGTMFPEKYRGGIFIAEHGSWNRSTPVGYRVTFVKIEGGRATSYEPFAAGLAQGQHAAGRPADVLVMPDGALLVADDKAGRIYRITYTAPARQAAEKGPSASLPPESRTLTYRSTPRLRPSGGASHLAVLRASAFGVPEPRRGGRSSSSRRASADRPARPPTSWMGAGISPSTGTASNMPSTGTSGMKRAATEAPSTRIAHA